MYNQTNNIKLLKPIPLVLKKTKKIFIYGVYGVGNLGDEAILKCILDQLNSIEDYQKIVISKRPDFIYKDYKKPSIHPFAFKIMASLLKSRSHFPLLLVGGGGILKDYGNSPKVLKKFLKIPMIGLENNYKTMLYSAGVENLEFYESIQFLKNVLNQFDIITVRDLYSKKRLEAIGIKKNIYVTGDPAVLLFSDIQKCKASTKKSPYITVNLRHWYEKGYFTTNEIFFDRFISTLANSLDFLIKNYDALIQFVPFRTMPFDNDLDIIKKVLSEMSYKEKTIVYERAPNFTELRKIFSHTDITIGMRLHSAIFSFSSLKPMIALSYSSKVKDFMNSIEMAQFCLDIKDINSDNIINLVNNIIKNKQNIQYHLYEKRKQYLKNLERNTFLLEKLL